MSKEQLMERVKFYLDKHKPDNVPMEVVESGVRDEGRYWHIPVRLTQEIARRSHFFDELADAEIDLMDIEGINVLFFPMATTVAAGIASK